MSLLVTPPRRSVFQTSPACPAPPPVAPPLETSHNAAAVFASSAAELAPLPAEPAASTLRTDLFASVWDAGAYSVMVGLGESYFGAYALALGLGPAAAGLMVTLPVLLGATLQLATPWGVRRVGSHKRWVVGGMMTQVACLLVLPLAALFVSTAAAIVAFSAVAFYWATGLAGNPAWNTWMEEVVPLRVRTRFFACRQRTSQVCLLLAFVLGGVALQFGRTAGCELAVFTAIFLVAATSRFISGCFVSVQSEIPRTTASQPHTRLRDLLASGKFGGGSLVAYLLAMQVAVQISGPYFTPFLLKQEQRSYLTYMALIGVAFVGKVLASPFWGRLGQRIGPVRLLWAGGLAVVPISGLWVFSDLFAAWELVVPLSFDTTTHVTIPGQVLYLTGVQLLSGIAWAAYELAMALLFLQGIPRRERTSMLTLYNFGNAAAMVGGGMIGFAVLRSFGESHNTYLLLFLLSSCVRLAMVPLLARVKA
jgi:hypothetical protein